MDRQTEIVTEIRRKCGEVERLPQFGWHFMYSGRHYIYMSTHNDNELRFCVPFLAKSEDYDNDVLTEAINETNREVKFIKAMVLESGCVSLDYDHKLTDGENIEEIVPHIIMSLDFASSFLTTKLNAL